MKNWKDKMYSKYISGHVVSAHNVVSRDDIKNIFPAWNAYFKKFLPLDKNASILDVGCGDGRFLFWLKELGYTNISGIDLSPEQVDRARELGIETVSCVDFRMFLENASNRYDCIIAKDFIEHFSKDEVLDVLNLFESSLRDGGVLLIQTPNAESPFGARYRYYDFTHEISFTQTSLSHALYVSGFSKTTFLSAAPVPHGIFSLVRWLLWQCVVSCIRLYLLIETGECRGIFTQNMIVCAQKKSHI